MASPAPHYPQTGYALPQGQQQYQPPSYPQYAQGTPPPQQPLQTYPGYPPQQPGQPQIIYVMPPPGQHPQWTGQQPPPPQGYAPGPAASPPPAEEKKKRKKNSSSSSALLFILALVEIGVVGAVVHYLSQGYGFGALFAPNAIGHFAAVLAMTVFATIVPCFTEPNVKKRSAIPIHAGFGTLLVLWLINIALIVTAPRYVSVSISNSPPLEKRKGGKGGSSGGSSSGGSSGSSGGGSGSNPYQTTHILASVSLYIAAAAAVFVVAGWISQTIKWRKRVKKYQAEGWPGADGATAPAEAKPFIQA